MGSKTYQIRNCPNCGLRYPLLEAHPYGPRCPLCLGKTRSVLKRRLASGPLNNTSGRHITQGINFALLDNIRSAWNVGAIFRTAEAFGIQKLYLCGITPTPENDAVKKTAMGTERVLPWEHSRNALEIAVALKSEGKYLIGLERDERSKSWEGVSRAIPENTVLIVGHEVCGVDPDVLDLCDRVLDLPMYGQVRSLNVAVALGIALSRLTTGPD